MKTIILNAPGSVDQLEYVDTAIPEIGTGEVLVKVKSISVNPVDTKVREGKGLYAALKDASPIILGWDIAGVIQASRSESFKPGDEVFGMVNFPGHGKAYAEYVAAPASQLAIKPVNVSFEEAAASTLVALTAWQALVTNGKVEAGQRVLIHAAAGGVGHIAVQLAKHLGAIVTGTSSSKNKDFVLGLGVDRHIDYRGFDWQVQPREYDFVLDTIGGYNIDNSIAVTREGGTIISIPTGLSDQVSERAKEKRVNGYFILVKSSGDDIKQIASLLEKGVIKPHVSQSFDFSQIREAHLQIESGRTVGKVVVVL
ncbi:NADPH:quinone reductase-like Zn-dependent oxidoreductase [Dyadobacter sp. BE34]|uniref:NADPH:quinone reductase-like Zn-dependent oxidoreductase n=1 Tax=Dyadobacter fermentans TaxID=94254 RepID=A0ABU1R6D0_9BACT|nr:MULTISPECIES: NADP-dependent oxidoreductase [Dyadobacter]MDR6808946.1 NADPH:quinone reductase-like Zn-dependent oxidoreductase [Dyadobacter fermentans]MDR7046689.1 NADPH:quinone reductase-like Zn-dependent oxidoreductase [Dyadobacter sp. BE242]MDR7201003.1 NADPH:quinone reductase-like Zn-dependent oxidoreductase [Dyadobacter sp. BE34]MDR7218963.1 NADPH:quinone reductase-like Zn-dependent oxidoreductase [Dyadobacter sp. BE31]MDR7264827.1 NADPH:quinone reductase-like Zn-dependent oxidoreducta